MPGPWPAGGVRSKWSATSPTASSSSPTASKRTIALDRPLLLGADGSRYPEPLRYQDHDLAEELDLVAVTRRQTARTLRLVAPDAWQRTAVHSETGPVTLRQLLLHAINHLRHHLRFVAEKRAAMTVP